MASDYYNVLGVERTATKDDIKQAYRRKAHQFHPDKDGGDEEKFKEVNAAYQVLSDDQKRQQYDQFGSTFEDAGGGPGGFGGFNVNVEDFGNVGDIFEQFFGGGFGGQRRARQQVWRGEDISLDVTVSFEESARGVTRGVSPRIYQTCEKCHGNGAEPGTPITECSTCSGSGTVTTTRQTMLGVFQQRGVCPKCRGEGREIKTACSECRGEGRMVREKRLEIEVPAGIAGGQTMRLSGKGEVPPRGGMAGDLYVTVHVTPHERLVRDGQTVRSTESISFTEAALGTVRTVETLEGERELAIPAGTQPGTELVLDSLGFPELGGSRRGDQVVTVQVEVPKKLSRKQKKLLEEFEGVEKKGFFG